MIALQIQHLELLLPPFCILVFCFASGGIGSVNHMPSRGSLYYPSSHGLPVCLAHTGEPMRDKCMFVCLLVSITCP
uniref:Putative secreted protein n=1 Tax=Anopheles darlingi TaxID=43151 RepID=A0A2M4D984_ANODA